ncbi:suppressor-of-stellate-like protein [Drosophila mauritiana]|uniref:Suppressor-of-stellate-like protein n=1 Tax=Drosophila mauritiana TaxID=7226 RepID=A0A6P8KN05_DROMA|nr:suppressor-of-stellate-like protein [Drosophila mauritiana]XP_033171649.1 suppressor-of-stellate-like protein [Drosophila mauritiana]
MSSPQSNESKVNSSWIDWFVGMKGNEFLCRVPIAFIESKSNLKGLKHKPEALQIVLDPIFDSSLDWVSGYEAELYGMIHARYILSAHGVDDMRLKFERGDFGRCPRFYCDRQRTLPVGLSDKWGQSTVKVYCPRCNDIFKPRSRNEMLDGAMFGTSFPHMFFMQLPMLRPQPPVEKYVPRIHGFRLHESALKPLESRESSTANMGSSATSSGTSSSPSPSRIDQDV